MLQPQFQWARKASLHTFVLIGGWRVTELSCDADVVPVQLAAALFRYSGLQVRWCA